MKLKILALSYLFPNPGQPEYGIFVYNRLKAVQEYCEVRVIAPLQWYPFRSLLRPALVSSRPVPLKENLGGLETSYPRLVVIPRYLKWFDAVSYFFSVRSLIRRMLQEGFQFDLVDAHWTYPDILAAYLVSRQYKRPFMVTVRGHEALYPGERGGRKRILDWCLRRADGVVALSSQLAELVVGIGVPREKVRVLLNGVDTANFRPLDRGEARKRLGLPAAKRILVSVGRLTEAKGHQHLIKALPHLAADFDVELHIVGGVNPESDYSAKLKSQMAALGLENVFFHDSVAHEELLYWYNAADLFCLASHGEGCPNVILEAMACGIPVVVTDVGAIQDIVCDGSNGLIAKNCEDFYEVLISALSISWDRESIARKMVDMSWRACARQVNEMYNDVMVDFGNRSTHCREAEH